MSKSDEREKLDGRYDELKKAGKTDDETLRFINSIFDLLDKTEDRLCALEDRVSKLEDFSDLISMDLFDIQSILMKKLKIENIPNLENIDIHSLFSDDDEEDDCDCGDDCCECGHHHDDDEEDEEEEDDNDEDGAKFVRCPFCNTLIFIKDDNENPTCPFCGEKFEKGDVET